MGGLCKEDGDRAGVCLRERIYEKMTIGEKLALLCLRISGKMFILIWPEIHRLKLQAIM